MLQHDDDLYLHDDLVETALEALMESGFRDVRAVGFEDVEEPAEVNGHQPDLQAVNRKGIAFIFAVETEKTLTDESIAFRSAAFAEHAKNNGTQFVVIVPEGSEGLAGAIFHTLEIPQDSYDIWEA